MRLVLTCVMLLFLGAAPTAQRYPAQKGKSAECVQDSIGKARTRCLDSLLHLNKLNKDLQKFRILHDTNKTKP